MKYKEDKNLNIEENYWALVFFYKEELSENDIK